MCMGVLSASTYVHHMHSHRWSMGTTWCPQNTEAASDSLGLELHMVVSHYVGVGIELHSLENYPMLLVTEPSLSYPINLFFLKK